MLEHGAVGLLGSWGSGVGIYLSHLDCPVIKGKADIVGRAWSLPNTNKSNSAVLGGVTLDKSFGLFKPQVPYL